MRDQLTDVVSVLIDEPALRRVCEMHETEFADRYGMVVTKVEERPSFEGDGDFYLFRDNGSPILAVAHLDTVVDHDQRETVFVDTTNGPAVLSGALDDRLGAYIILELLPSLGIQFDWLLTTGEESGRSTAEFFDPADHHEREYSWIIEFDRGGMDVVMYEYEDKECIERVNASGAPVGFGSFSDICYLEHLGVKGFNWGVAYRDYHSTNGHAYLDETAEMVGCFLRFYDANKEVVMPHEERSYRGTFYDNEQWDHYYGKYMIRCDSCSTYSVDPDTEWCEICETCNVCWNYQDDCECEWAVAQREEMRRAEEAGEVAELMPVETDWRQRVNEWLSALDR